MSLLVRSHVVTLTFRLPDGVSLTRLVVGAGILVTEVVNTGERMIINMRVYADALVVGTTRYPILMVVNLST